MKAGQPEKWAPWWQRARGLDPIPAVILSLIHSMLRLLELIQVCSEAAAADAQTLVNFMETSAFFSTFEAG